MYLLHTLNPCHLKNTRLQKGSRISSESGSIIMPFNLFSPPYCSFSKVKILGRKLTTKCAQVGQRACPCWVTCLPQVGKHVAPKWEKTSRYGIVQKSSFSVFIFDDLQDR